MSLTLEEIAKLEELKVEPQELQARVMQTMVQGGLMNYLQQLPKQQADEISQRITMDSANQILNDKLMQRLIQIASGKSHEMQEIEDEMKALDEGTLPPESETEESDETESETTVEE